MMFTLSRNYGNYGMLVDYRLSIMALLAVYEALHISIPLYCLFL